MQDKKIKIIYIYQIWLNFVLISFNHLQVTVSPFLFFFLFSSQWLHLRLTFSWAAPHVSRAVAIQCDYCCACLFHQCKTVKIFTKIGIFRPAIYVCKKVLDYQILTEDLAKTSNINSQIVLLKDHKPATSVVSYKVTSNLLHLSNFVKSALHGSVPSPLRHSRHSLPGRETSAQTDWRHIRRLNRHYFCKLLPNPGEEGMEAAVPSWESILTVKLAWKPMGMSVINKGWSRRRAKPKPKPSPCWAAGKMHL